MFDQMTLWDTPNATSSPAWEAGQSLPALQDGQTTAPCGPRPARVSRSRPPAKVPVLLIQGTYGPTFFASSVPEGPLSSWENRLRQRLARIGSSECDLTWKASAMSDGALLSRLVPSTPRTVEIDSGLLLEAALWVTCTTRDHKDTPGMSLERSDGRSRVDQLPRQVAATLAAQWAPPTASERSGQGPKNTSLMQQARLESAMWPTATAVDGARGMTTRPQDTGIPLPQRVGRVLGMEPAGSSGTTAKRGVLNPAFPCWLMGYPLAHLSCGVTAMPSSRNLRQK